MTFDQPSLWSGPAPYTPPVTQAMVRRDSQDTSNGAAVIALHRAVDVRRKVLEALTAAGADGLNDFELAAVTGIKQTHSGKRRLDLVRQGLVEPVLTDDGLPLRRPSDTGSPSMVWRAVAQ